MSPLTPIEKPKTATERLNDVKEHLAELKAKAILEPTSENVKVYQEMQMKVVNQSEAFSKAWMMNVYMNPSLDENISNPSAQGARFVVYENERKNTDKIITGLKETYGLFYFYSGSCAYCKAFAPIVKQFADKYGWDVMAISLDGAPSDVFSNWQPDNGISHQWNVQTVPAVFAVNPLNNDVIPVAHGFTAIDAMEKRIVAIVNGGRK
jgi:conjugal transfer pilus assembly protein TraF